MRIRSIKPEFWESLDTARLDYFTRLLFIGLWSYVDDNGVGIDAEGLIQSKLFPNDFADSELSLRIHGGLAALSNGGQIVRYTGPDTRPYLYIVKWDDHQRINRPSASRKPLPTSDGVVFRESSRQTHAPLTEGSPPEQGTGSREQGAGNEGETRSLSPARATRFDEFWSLYPRKVGKQKAIAKYAAAVRRTGDEQTVIDGARRLATDPNLPDDRNYIPHPTTWLERGGWEDEPLPARNGSPRAAAQHTKAHAWSEFEAADTHPYDHPDVLDLPTTHYAIEGTPDNDPRTQF